MQRKPLFWLFVSLSCLVGAIYFWRLGNQWEAQKAAARIHAAAGDTLKGGHPTPAGTPAPAGQPGAANFPQQAAARRAARSEHHLSNATATPHEWAANDRAILLENALVDTTKPLNLPIPAALRAPANGGTYLVQSKGPINDAFRARLGAAGATVVSYVPNNALMVRVSDASAQTLGGDALVQSVLPYEPYYKMPDPGLLKAAVEGQPLPGGTSLDVVLFSDAVISTLASLDRLGASVVSQTTTPFGPQLQVRPAPGTLTDLARLPGVQLISLTHQRVAANDIVRPTLGVSPDPTTNTVYLGLSGTNVMLSLADNGVDATHPDLVGRVFGDLLTDTSGHGTHVAGTMIGSGLESFTVVNAIGSLSNANFAGMAPLATLYSIALNSDVYVQETAAAHSFICNNSWLYGNTSDYDIASASYDAAVRDALPGVSGPQPVLFVFAAGNNGNGDDGGQNGDPDSIQSPATAKNVITVGAVEMMRNITNVFTQANGTNPPTTSQPYLASSDSSDQVASFSARGNVGIGIEGDFGRFKPDVVAPGTHVISDRSSQWDTNGYYFPTYVSSTIRENQTVNPGELHPYSLFVPANAIGVVITIQTNFNSPNPLALPIYVSTTDNPTTNTAGFEALTTNVMNIPPDLATVPTNAPLFYSIGNNTADIVNYNVEIDVLTTNDDPVLSFFLRTNLNDTLGNPPYYRYESGTSMAAAGVSGMLGLMQEFFEQRLQLTNSPALMKALLINGARSVGQLYDLSVQNAINYQGWGQPSLSNSIPGSLSNLVNNASAGLPVQFFDQSPSNALATGQSLTRTISLTPAAQAQDLRITLVWTDPPGNPAASIKLVNDLDLIVTNLDTGDVFIGNDIPGGSVYTESWDTNAPPNVDRINNVENVYLAAPLGTNYAVTVTAHRVNVNAVTANTNAIVQDFALVVGSGDGGLVPNALTASPPVSLLSASNAPPTIMTNGIPLLSERVGANPPEYGPGTNGAPANTNGLIPQWNFYVYTNTTNFPNVAFITFLPPELAVSRLGASSGDPNNAVRVEADVDLYVSGDPGLLTLDPAAVAAADVSRTREGTEKVLYSNSVPGQVYYIGVKSEGQEGGQYAFLAVASPLPFGRLDANGNVLLTPLIALPSMVPDGSPALPGSTNILLISTEPGAARRVVVTNTLIHPRAGDLLTTLTHGQKFVVLKNHTPFDNGTGTETYIYDDSGENDIPGARKSDGPGSLRTFVGDSVSAGVWIFNAVDDAPTEIGQIANLQITIEPELPTNNIPFTIQPHQWRYYFIDVPAAATNLTATVSSNDLPVDLYFELGQDPTQTTYDKFQVMNPPLASVSLSIYDNPPLNAGRYFIGLYNPNNATVTGILQLFLGLNLQPVKTFSFFSPGNEPILDDAVTDSQTFVNNDSQVVSATVGLRIDHPRESDLAITLISPKGTRVLLSENRGGLDTNGYGTGINITNVFPTQVAGSNLPNVAVLGPVGTFGTVVVNYDFYDIPDFMHIYYDGVLIYDTGSVSNRGSFSVDFGPGIATNVVIIMDEGGGEAGTMWTYTAAVITRSLKYMVFTEDTNYATVPIKFFPPPFGISGFSTSLLLSDFEDIPQGDYLAGTSAGTNVDGWSVLTNKVTITNIVANTGSQALHLRNGNIGRTLATRAGDQYILNFASRRSPALPGLQGWWTGDLDPNGLAVDLVNTNNGTVNGGVQFVPGEAGQAFDFSGFGSRIQVPNASNLNFGATSPMSIELWAERIGVQSAMSLVGKRQGFATQFNYHLTFDAANGLQFGGSSGGGVFTGVQMPVGQWMHLAATFDGVNFSFYTNGVLAATGTGTLGPVNTGTFVIGGSGLDEFYDGLLDEVSIYSRALTAAEVLDIYKAGSLGKCSTLTPPVECPECRASLLVNGGLIRSVTGTTNWQTNALAFTATGPGTPVEIDSTNCPSGMVFDTFVLNDSPGGPYILPEEPLDKVIGEPSQGTWTLEVLDNRAGATNPPPSLVSWELNLVLANSTPAATPLLEGVPVTNSVNAGEIVYFSVDVPVWAQFATNMLSAATGPLNLLFNQNAEPTGTNGGDYTLLGPVTAGQALLSITGPPPQLVPGARYYLGVQNPSATSPVTFSLEVDFDITTLSNAVLVTSAIAPSTVPRYFQFDVLTNAPLGGQAVVTAFELIGPNGDVNLVVRKGLPLPDLNGFDYSSMNSGSNSEAVVVVTNSAPVPLTPGRWYLGVINNDTSVVGYHVRATEPGPPTLVDLDSGVAVDFNSDPGVALTNFFRFDISTAENDSAALFEIFNLSGNVDLTVQRGSLPYVSPFSFISDLPGTNMEQITIFTNQLGTNIDVSWFIGAPNNDPTNVTYTVAAAVLDSNGVFTVRSPLSIAFVRPTSSGTTGPTLKFLTTAGQQYQVLVSSDLKTWTVATTFTATGPTTTYTDQTPILSQPGRFYRIATTGPP